jgi:hypothetical protein
VEEVWEDDGIVRGPVRDGDRVGRPSVVYCGVELDEVLGSVGRMGEPTVKELRADAC